MLAGGCQGAGSGASCTHCIVVTEVLARPRAVFWAPLLVRAILDEDATAPDNGATGARPSFRVDCVGEPFLGEDAAAPDNGATGARSPFIRWSDGCEVLGLGFLGSSDQGFLGFL